MAATLEKKHGTPNADAFLDKIDAYKLEKARLMNDLIQHGILNPNATSLPDNYAIPLLEKYELRGALREAVEKKDKEE